MVKLSDEEFMEIMSNFHEFMEEHGYVTIKEMADNVWYCTPSCIRHMVHDCRLTDGVIHLNEKSFIRKDMPYPQKRMVTDAPKGYVTVKECADRNGISEATIRTKIYHDRMPKDSIVRANNRWYVKDDTIIGIKKSMSRSSK